MPTAMAKYPRDGRHACSPPPDSVGDGLERRGAFMAETAWNDQGADGLKVETAQPMRSWPNWFQIGFLPPVMVE